MPAADPRLALIVQDMATFGAAGGATDLRLERGHTVVRFDYFGEEAVRL